MIMIWSASKNINLWVTSFTILISPIDCSVIKTAFEISISSHKYLDNQTGDRLVKVMGFLTELKVYNYHCSMSYIQDFVSESETKIPNPFKPEQIFAY